MVSFEPLGNPTERLFCSVLTLDANGVRILIDCGWDADLSIEALAHLETVLPTIDLVILTHASLSHAGAFSYLRAKHPSFRSIPAYATLPVARMGLLATLDAYISMGLCGAFASKNLVLTSDQVEETWSEVLPLKYSQPVHIRHSPKLEGTVITAYNAGHSLGGALYNLGDGVDSVVVALDWNHARDAHLSGAFLEPKTGMVVADLQRPTLLITSSDVSAPVPVTKARQKFLDAVDSAINRGGTVLVPSSCGARLLELALLLGKHTKKGIPVYLYSPYAKHTLVQASAMLEWMVPSIISDWQVQNESPFDMPRIKCIAELPSASPCVVLATGESLEQGTALTAFLKLADDPQSTVIFTETPAAGTLAAKVMSEIPEEGAGVLASKLQKVPIRKQQALTDKALAAYDKQMSEEKQQREEAIALERRNQQLIDTSAAAEQSSESDSEYDEFDPTAIGSGMLLYENVYDYRCSEPSEQFPFYAKRARVDDYGEYLPSGMFDRKKPKEKKKEDDEKAETQDDVMEDSGTVKVDEVKERPMKMVTEKRNIKLACWAVYADMNGLTNLRSLQMVLKQLQPSRIVVIPGKEGVPKGIEPLAKEVVVADQTVTFERINFAADVRIDQKVKLRWHDIYGGHAVARVHGKIELEPGKRSGVVLVAADLADSSEPQSQSEELTVGDLRLTTLRKLLNEQGMKAEFRGQGVLVCADKVLVKKNADNVFSLEGGLDDEYYTVRNAVRQFIASI